MLGSNGPLTEALKVNALKEDAISRSKIAAILVCVFSMTLMAPRIVAQSAASRPEFEVASVRPSVPLPPPPQVAGGRGGGEGIVSFRQGTTINGGRVDFAGATLARLIAFAFRIPENRVMGPDWMVTERFNVVAKLPQCVSEDQVPEMLQTLLADRFKLAVHRGSKEQSVYALVVNKGGLKLKEASPDSAGPVADPNAPPCPPQNLNCASSIGAPSARRPTGRRFRPPARR